MRRRGGRDGRGEDDRRLRDDDARRDEPARERLAAGDLDRGADHDDRPGPDGDDRDAARRAGPALDRRDDHRPPPPPPPRPRTAAIRSWPSGHRGYTVVLQSLPESLGRAAAVARAEQARRAGVAAVGVLRSCDFSSLRAGYWVVFAGDFATSEQAQSAAGADRARGSAGAYPAAVTP